MTKQYAYMNGQECFVVKAKSKELAKIKFQDQFGIDVLLSEVYSYSMSDVEDIEDRLTIYETMKKVIEELIEKRKIINWKRVTELYKVLEYPSWFLIDEAIERERIAVKEHNQHLEHKYGQDREFTEDDEGEDNE